MSSSPNDTACPACICPAGDDSPLSYVGNISGILTFAVALLASLIVTSRLFAQAHEDMVEARRMMFVNQQKTEHLSIRFNKLIDGPAREVVMPGSGTRAWVEGILSRMSNTERRLETILGASPSDYNPKFTLIERLRFVYDQKEKLDGYFVELSRCHEELREAFAKWETEAMIDHILPDTSTSELLPDDPVKEKEPTGRTDGDTHVETSNQLRNIQKMLAQVLYRLELLEGSTHDPSLTRPKRADVQPQPRIGRTL